MKRGIDGGIGDGWICGGTDRKGIGGELGVREGCRVGLEGMACLDLIYSMAVFL